MGTNKECAPVLSAVKVGEMGFRDAEWREKQEEYSRLPEMPSPERRHHFIFAVGDAMARNGQSERHLPQPGHILKGDWTTTGWNMDAVNYKITLTQEECHEIRAVYRETRKMNPGCAIPVLLIVTLLMNLATSIWNWA